MDGTITWYDSHWLRAYLAARETIARVAPSRLSEFVGALDILRTDPQFSVRDVKRLFDADGVERIKQIIARIPRQNWEMYEFQRFGRIIVHDHPDFTSMQADLTERVSELAGEPVEPRYNFLCLYTKLGVCTPHLDSPAAKWTLDICIDQSEPWPIHFSHVIPWPDGSAHYDDDWQTALRNDSDLRFQTKLLHPGDAVFFSGSSQWHYRDEFRAASSNAFCHLLFFHYIPKGTRELALPLNWARLFDIPELAMIPGIEEAV